MTILIKKVMFKYIENLKNEYLKTNDNEKKEKIIDKLKKEKDSCNKIISKYLLRNDEIGIKCTYTCKHEELIIDKINKILNNLN